MKKAPILLVALALLILPMYAVIIELATSNIDQIGGTGKVDVDGPGQISKVKWVLTDPPAPRVSSVTIEWKPANEKSYYMVYMTIYNKDDNVIAYGSTPSEMGDNPRATTINLNTNVDPKEIYKVEIIIVEQ